MKCPDCGEKATTRREPYLYDEESGMPVTLFGIEVVSCPSCGARSAIVPHPLALCDAITSTLCRKKGRLSGPEFRWLRGTLKKNGRETARLLGVGGVSLSRWEGGSTQPGTPVDKLLRVLAAREGGDKAYSIADIEAAASEDSAVPLKMSFEWTRAEWHLNEAAPAKQKPAA